MKCRTFESTGMCPYGDRCRFIHDVPSDEEGDRSSKTMLPERTQDNDARASDHTSSEASGSADHAARSVPAAGQPSPRKAVGRPSAPSTDPRQGDATPGWPAHAAPPLPGCAAATEPNGPTPRSVSVGSQRGTVLPCETVASPDLLCVPVSPGATPARDIELSASLRASDGGLAMGARRAPLAGAAGGWQWHG